MLNIENLSYKHTHCDNFALKDITLNLEKGESILITGRSGSGKSTLLSVLSGLVPHYYKGEKLGSVRICGFTPDERDLIDIGKDVALMLQNSELQFFAPSVNEELYLTLRCRGIPEKDCEDIVLSQLRKFKIEHIRNSQVSMLSEGQKQKVVLASITALKPSVILLDEPTANLDPVSIAELREILLLLKNEGVSFVISDHRLSWVDGICEKGAVISWGRIAWYGSYADMHNVCAEHELRSMREVTEKSCGIYCGDDSVSVENLTFSYEDKKIFEDLTFSIPFGKITTLNGPSGVGKTTLARVLSGLESEYGGAVYFKGKKADKAFLTENTTVILQNCDHQLYMNTVVGEISLAMYACMRKKENYEDACRILEKFGLEGLANRHPQSLSGGEKQRLVIAAGVVKPPMLLILDEPTSGMDGYNLNRIAKYIKELTRTGAAVLVITHDVELINLCADYKIKLDKEGLI